MSKYYSGTIIKIYLGTRRNRISVGHSDIGNVSLLLNKVREICLKLSIMVSSDESWQTFTLSQSWRFLFWSFIVFLNWLFNEEYWRYFQVGDKNDLLYKGRARFPRNPIVTHSGEHELKTGRRFLTDLSSSRVETIYKYLAHRNIAIET